MVEAKEAQSGTHFQFGGTVTLKSRIDTAIEVEYVRHGGILPYVLRQLLGA